MRKLLAKNFILEKVLLVAACFEFKKEFFHSWRKNHIKSLVLAAIFQSEIACSSIHI